MTEIPLAQPVTAPQPPIAEDMLCVACGYNLRGLLPDGRCPECGSPVNRSVHGNLLQYADAEWLRTALLGVRLMLWGILLMILVHIASSIGTGFGFPELYFIPPILVLACLDLLAAFLITVQEPRISSTEDMVTWRRVIRICALASFLGQALIQLRPILHGSLFPTVGALLYLAAVPVYFGKFIYLRRFALRIPDPKLARSTRIVMWGFVITIAGTIVLAIIAAALGGAFSADRSGNAAGALSGVMCLAGIGLLVFGLWYLVLLVDYRNAFRDALFCVQQYTAAMARQGRPAQ